MRSPIIMVNLIITSIIVQTLLDFKPYLEAFISPQAVASLF